MSPKSIEGPVGIAQMSGETAREGPAAFLSLMAAVSLNLAIFNLLADSDSGRRRDPDAADRNAAAPRSGSEGERSGGESRLRVPDDGVVFVIYNDISKMLPG